MRVKNHRPLYFMGIGAPKCGTTQVSDWIAGHPSLCLSVPKEVLYFNKKISYIHGPNENRSKSLDWYEKHFAHCKIDQKIGEFSASYIYDADAAKKIKALYPDIKIIVCLRNPVDRTYSQYLMFRDYLKKEERPFEEAIQNEPELLARSKYAEFLKAYLELFPRQNFLFLTLDEIVNEAQSTLKRVFQFLEVDASFVPADFMTNRKKASASRSPLVSKTMGLFTKTMTGLGLSGVVLKLKEMGLKDTVLKMNSKNIIKEKLNPALRNELKKQFAEDIVRTAELTGLDLSKWK